MFLAVFWLAVRTCTFWVFVVFVILGLKVQLSEGFRSEPSCRDHARHLSDCIACDTCFVQRSGLKPTSVEVQLLGLLVLVAWTLHDTTAQSSLASCMKCRFDLSQFFLGLVSVATSS